MRIFGWVLIGLVFTSLSVKAGTAPPEYWQMSGPEKRAFHVKQGIATPYRYGPPQTLGMFCTQGMAIMGAVSKRYLRRTIEDGSGYPDDVWRYLFGKAVHTFGPMAPGQIEITKPVFDLQPGTYAATLRFSLANAYVNWLPGADFRPGLMIIIHRDGDQEDRGLFLMPPDGLTGFSKPVNPFLYHLVNHLEIPGRATQTLAAMTFGRVVSNVYRQVVNPDYGSLLLKPVGRWLQDYEKTWNKSQFGEKLAQIPAGPQPEPMYEIFGYDGNAVSTTVGTLSLTGPFIISRHANAWFVPHKGFEARQ